MFGVRQIIFDGIMVGTIYYFKISDVVLKLFNKLLNIFGRYNIFGANIFGKLISCFFVSCLQIYCTLFWEVIDSMRKACTLLPSTLG